MIRIVSSSRKLLLSTALTTSNSLIFAIGMASLGSAPALAQDSGAVCVMVDGACDLTTPVHDGGDGPGAGSREDGNPGTPGSVGGISPRPWWIRGRLSWAPVSSRRSTQSP
jgi:hypothetical protein